MFLWFHPPSSSCAPCWSLHSKQHFGTLFSWRFRPSFFLGQVQLLFMKSTCFFGEIDDNHTRVISIYISYYIWLVVWNIFPYIGNSNSSWLIFFRGVETTNQILSVNPPFFTGKRKTRRWCPVHRRAADGKIPCAADRGGRGRDFLWWWYPIQYN